MTPTHRSAPHATPFDPSPETCRQRRRVREHEPLGRTRLWLCLLAPLCSCAATVPSEPAKRSAFVGSEASPSAAAGSALDDGLTSCPSVTIEKPEDLSAARSCREIDGDLIFAPSDTMEIDAAALPFLERVTGSVLTRVPAPVREISLPALGEVGSEGNENALQFVFDRMTLERVSLPSLRVVHGTLGIAALGALEELDLGSLESVDDVFGLMNLPKLAQLELPSDVAVGQRVAFEYLCRIPYDALPATSLGSQEAPRVRMIGCCTESRFECTFAACECE